jgi:hypothetical protein
MIVEKVAAYRKFTLIALFSVLETKLCYECEEITLLEKHILAAISLSIVKSQLRQFIQGARPPTNKSSR